MAALRDASGNSPGGSKPIGSHFGVGAPPILVYFSGDWDVHWGYGGFDPWPDKSAIVGLEMNHPSTSKPPIQPTSSREADKRKVRKADFTFGLVFRPMATRGCRLFLFLFFVFFFPAKHMQTWLCAVLMRISFKMIGGHESPIK